MSYPASLPCPQVSIVAPAERRLASDLSGNKQYRALQRDYLATERLQWTLRQDESETFQAWWRDELREGGAWFSAHWPSPQGGTLARRFTVPPRWEYIHNGAHKRMWRVSAECEVRRELEQTTPLGGDFLAIGRPDYGAARMYDESVNRAVAGASGNGKIVRAGSGRWDKYGYRLSSGSSYRRFYGRQFIPKPGGFTLEAWIRPYAAFEKNVYHRILGIENVDDYVWIMLAGPPGNNEGLWFAVDTSELNQQAVWAGLWASGQWFHVAIDGSPANGDGSSCDIAVYFNGLGVCNTALNWPAVPGISGSLLVGEPTDAGGYAVDIDDIRLTNGVRLYPAANFDPPTKSFGDA